VGGWLYQFLQRPSLVEKTDILFIISTSQSVIINLRKLKMSCIFGLFTLKSFLDDVDLSFLDNISDFETYIEMKIMKIKHKFKIKFECDDRDPLKLCYAKN